MGFAERSPASVQNDTETIQGRSLFSATRLSTDVEGQKSFKEKPKYYKTSTFIDNSMGLWVQTLKDQFLKFQFCLNRG